MTVNDDEFKKLSKCDHIQFSFKHEYYSKKKSKKSHTNKLYPKYVPRFSRFVHLVDQTAFRTSGSFLTGHDLYNNLSRSQIEFLTKQHENEPQKLQNSDVNDFEKWKTTMWSTWYKNMNFVIEKWDTEIIYSRNANNNNSEFDF